MLELLEPINVWVFFKGAKIEPFVFFWRERRIKIEQINLVHDASSSGKSVRYFSISAQGNFYRLMLDLKDLKWFIDKVEEG